jgi:hypothetical protein
VGGWNVPPGRKQCWENWPRSAIEKVLGYKGQAGVLPMDHALLVLSGTSRLMRVSPYVLAGSGSYAMRILRSSKKSNASSLFH